MMYKSRKEFLCQTDWLFYLFNDLGCENLALQMSGKLPNGDVWFSKRYKYSMLMELDPFEKIPLFNTVSSRKVCVSSFLQQATHRTILDIELVFDIDDEPILETAKKIMREYSRHNPMCYFTGSKSYHVHIFVEKLRNSFYKKFKQGVLRKHNSDGCKGSENQLIAIEGAKHYRSGKIKKEVDIWQI